MSRWAHNPEVAGSNPAPLPESAGQGPDRRKAVGPLIFVAAWWQLDSAGSDMHGRQESADIGIRRRSVADAQRGQMVWPGTSSRGRQPTVAPAGHHSQQELADAVGSVREVVARVLADSRIDPAGGDLTRQHPHPRPGRTPRAVIEPRRQCHELPGDLRYAAALPKSLTQPGTRRRLVSTRRIRWASGPQEPHVHPGCHIPGREGDKALALEQRMPGLVIRPAHGPAAAQRLIGSAP
jgi:hypothetical protein